MLTSMGSVLEEPGSGFTGTGAQLPADVKISRPGCNGSLNNTIGYQMFELRVVREEMVYK